MTARGTGEEWKDMRAAGGIYRPDDALIAAAKRDIEAVRKRDVTLRIEGRDGSPLAGETVEVVQTQSAFPWGDQLWDLDRMVRYGEDETDTGRYHRKLFAELLNAANCLCYWTDRDVNDGPKTEDVQGDPQMTGFARCVDRAAAQGLQVKGHPLFWSIDKCVPVWVKRYDYTTQMKFAEVRVRNLVARFRGKVKIWDAVNEPMWEPAFKNLPQRHWPHIEPIPDIAHYIEQVLRWCRDEDPDATFLINDYGMEQDKADEGLSPVAADGTVVTAAMQRKRYLALIRELQERGMPPDAIGLQWHTGGCVDHATQLAIYDEMATAGLPVHITEFWAHTRRFKEQGVPEEEAAQAQVDYVVNHLTCAFGHPAVEGFFWGMFNDAVKWGEHSSHSPRAIYHRLRDLLNREWMTRETLTTDDEGCASFRGFYGSYVLRCALSARVRHPRTEVKTIVRHCWMRTRRAVAPMRLSAALVLVAATAMAMEGDAPTSTEPVVPAGQHRTQKAIDGGPLLYWPDREDRAEVMTAGFVGGKGNEWLVDGGFLDDGRLVLAGNAIGGDFQLSVPVRTIGADGAAPPPLTPVAVIDRKTKQPALDQTGKPRYQAVKYTDDGVTGFLVVLDPTLRRIASAARLGWGSGAITACEVAPDGGIYVAGRAEPGAARLAADSDTAPAAVEGIKGAPCSRTFVARLAPDLSRAQWVRVVEGPAYAPRLTLRRDGTLVASLADLRTYDAKGKLLACVSVKGGLGDRNSVSPLNGEVVYGGEHNWGTGREPWRCPVLNINHPDGRLRYQLMDWGGPFVGLDSLRLVSDTAVRRVSHDRKGNIIAILWSDGGNSVGHCQPTDIRRHIGNGCGLTTAGAGATSFAYLMRIEPEHYQAVGWTLWCSQWGRKANGASIERTGEADDGSTCFAGGTAWGLRQTANRLSTTEPGGYYAAVLTPGLSGVRFSSTVPGAGMAQVGDGCAWGVVTGSPGGKGRAVFLCGASRDGDNYGLITPTPTVRALQPQFGGGIMDGWYLVLDLSKPAPPAKVTLEPAEGRMTVERDARRDGQPLSVPDGAAYVFTPSHPKWVTADAEFRHPDPARFWPNFFYGRPASGRIAWGAKGPAGSFTIVCDQLAQPYGEQDRRILGELIEAGAKPPVTLTVKSLGSLKEESIERKDHRGNPHVMQVAYCEADAVLDVAGRTVNLRPRVTFKPAKVVERSTEALNVSAWFTLTGRQLGLKGRARDETLDVRITAQGIKE